MVTGRKDKSTEIEISDYGCRTERRNSRIVWQLFVPFFWRNFLMENIISRELYSSQKDRMMYYEKEQKTKIRI